MRFVGLLPLGNNGRLTRAPTIKLSLNEGLVYGQPCWAAVNHYANSRAMRLAKGMDAKKGSKGISGHVGQG